MKLVDYDLFAIDCQNELILVIDLLENIIYVSDAILFVLKYNCPLLSVLFRVIFELLGPVVPWI
jgi:hypothetical protein